MNTYMYAPKDDDKHRHFWRVLYTEEEVAQLKQLIDRSKECKINFVYAISPGIDMMYSSAEELQILHFKLKQVYFML